jgi:hypothetical protein
VWVNIIVAVSQRVKLCVLGQYSLHDASGFVDRPWAFDVAEGDAVNIFERNRQMASLGASATQGAQQRIPTIRALEEFGFPRQQVFVPLLHPIAAQHLDGSLLVRLDVVSFVDMTQPARSNVPLQMKGSWWVGIPSFNRDVLS